MSDGFKTGMATYVDRLHNLEYFMDPNFDWNTLHTRHLLDLRISELARENPELHAKIKEVLATREHVPTKAEAKAKRQQIAKQKKHR